MILDEYFIRLCIFRYHVPENVLYDMLKEQNEECMGCGKTFKLRKDIYLDYDFLRLANHGLVCKRCYVEKQENYHSELEALQRSLKEIIPSMTNIVEISEMLKRPDVIDFFRDACSKIGIDPEQAMKKIKLIELV